MWGAHGVKPKNIIACHHKNLLDFCGAGEDNGGRGIDSPGGRHPIRTNSAPTPITPLGKIMEAEAEGNGHRGSVKWYQNHTQVIRHIKVKGKRSIAVRKKPHRYGNSRAIWDHTVLPATRQR